MTISSAPVPSNLRNGTAGESAKEHEAASVGLFALLLPADGSGASGGPKETADDTVPDDEAVPSPAEQTNLAALLYALSAVAVVPLPDESLTPSDRGGTAPEAPDSAIADGSGNEPTPRPPVPAVFAVSQKAGAILPEGPPANPSRAALTPAPPEAGLKISQSPADDDAALEGGQSAVVERGHGTGGAKRTFEMNEASAMNPASRPSLADARSNVGELKMGPSAPGAELSAESQRKPQDSRPANAGDAHRGDAESFSLAPSLSQTVITSGTSSPTTAPKPMTPAAVVDEVGLGLDRMQMQGSSRIDLHLTLAGGSKVSIELQIRDGAVQASFHTGSTELREALEHSWSQLAGRSQTLGLALAAPIFKAPAAVAANAGQQDFREHRQESHQEQSPAFIFNPTSPQPKRASKTTIPTHRTARGLNAWA